MDGLNSTQSGEIQQGEMNFKPLRVAGAAFFAAIGIAVATHATIGAFLFVRDFLWRLPKGFLSWDMQGSMGAYLLSTALFAVMCFVLARGVYRWQWSRRRILSIVGLSAASFVLFATFFLWVGAGLNKI